MNKVVLHICIGLFTIVGFSQSSLNTFLIPSDTLHKPRRNTVIISEVVLASVSLIALDQLWYKDYPRSEFHTLNDNNAWLQIDKLGHAFTSYQVGKLGAHVLNWSGVSKKDQLIYGATLGITYLTAIEVFDGYSEEWGFSWGDMFANLAGTSLFVGQELLWDEQRISLKYSFHQTQYATQRPDKLGDGLAQELLKDYNGQTYWLSVNIHSFFKDSKIPTWLNVAFGYGAEGMLTGEKETLNELYPNQNRIRQFYFSLDIDLTRIKTKSHFLMTVFDVFNAIKVPLPTLEFTDKNGITFHGIYF